MARQNPRRRAVYISPSDGAGEDGEIVTGSDLSVASSRPVVVGKDEAPSVDGASSERDRWLLSNVPPHWGS